MKIYNLHRDIINQREINQLSDKEFKDGIIGRKLINFKYLAFI